MDYFVSDKWTTPRRGDLLISEPYLPDPNFERTVVLLCEHDENGTFGFILNKPSNTVFDDVFEEVKGFNETLYIGGPVHEDSLHFIHRDFDTLQSGSKVKNEIFWGGDFDLLLAKIDTKQINPADYRFFIGYSGWSPGQLEEELKAKSWIVFENTTEDLLFETPPEKLWQEVLKQMGGKFKVISNYPTDPRLN